MHDASLQRAQASTRSTRQAPQAPTPPPPPDVPRTPEEFDALVQKRSELKNQLESVTDRREELASQLEDADPAARPGLVERIQTLDQRAERLEKEILQADDAIAVAVAGGVAQGPQEEETTTQPPDENFVSKEVLANAMLAEAVAFMLLGVFFYRWVLRRARERFSRGSPQDAARLDQLQNAVDAIAVEIERISEGQRYVSKALNEGGFQAAAGSGGREEALIPRKGT